MTAPRSDKDTWDLFYERLKSSNDEVAKVQREVAVHLNTIANQLVSLARLSEDSVEANKELGHVIKDLVDASDDTVCKAMETSCRSCLIKIESSEKGNEQLAKMMVALGEKIDRSEKERIKNSTIYLLVVGAIAGGIGLATALVTMMDKFLK